MGQDLLDILIGYVSNEKQKKPYDLPFSFSTNFKVISYFP